MPEPIFLDDAAAEAAGGGETPEKAGGSSGESIEESRDEGKRGRAQHSGGRQMGQKDDDDGNEKPAAKPRKTKESDDDDAPKTRARKLKHRGEEFDFDPDNDESLAELERRLSAPHKVKVDGSELELSHEDLYRGYEHSEAARRRMSQAAQLQQEQQQWVARMQQDPTVARDWLLSQGIDPMQFLYADVMEHERIAALGRDDPSLTPEQNATRRQEHDRLMYERSKAAARRELELEQRAERERAEAQRKREAAQQLWDGLTGTADRPGALAAAGLELDGITRPLLVDLHKHMTQTGQQVTPEGLAFELARSMREFQQRRGLAQLPKADDPAALVKLLGEDRLKALRKHLAKEEKSRLDAAASTPSGDSGGGSGDNPPSTQRRKTGTLADAKF